MDKVLNHVYFNNLFDLYGNLLNIREKEIFNLFYEEDLSLQEIANLKNVSKSSVGKTIQVINKKLENYESKLGFLTKFDKLKKHTSCIKDENLRKKITKIIEKEL